MKILFCLSFSITHLSSNDGRTEKIRIFVSTGSTFSTHDKVFSNSANSLALL